MRSVAPRSDKYQTSPSSRISFTMTVSPDRWYRIFFIAMGAVGTLALDGSLDRWLGRGASSLAVLVVLGGVFFSRKYFPLKSKGGAPTSNV